MPSAAFARCRRAPCNTSPAGSRNPAAAIHTRSSGKHFAVGEQVRQGKFGPGLVLEVDDKTVTVMFDSVGRKKLAKDVAPIEKI